MSNTKQSIEQQQDTNIVQIIDKSGVELGVGKILEQNISLLPDNAVMERIKTSAGFYIANREDLMKMDGKAKLKMIYGVLKEAMVGCEAGIDFDIVPFKGEPTVVRKKEGWFKIIDLIKPSEIIRFISNVGTKGDILTFNPSTEEIHHELLGDRGQKFEDIIGAYAYVKFANGFEKTVYMSKEDLQHLKDKSPSGKTDFSPWNTNSIKMSKTKVTKELAKELFTLFSGRVNTVVATAIESDELPVSRVDKKGYIVNDYTIYEEQSTKVIEEVKNDNKEVNINDL